MTTRTMGYDLEIFNNIMTMILFTDVKHDFHGDRGWTSRVTSEAGGSRKVMNPATLRNLITILLSPPPPPSTGGSTFYKQTGGGESVDKSIFVDEIRSVVMWLIFLRDLDNIKNEISKQTIPEQLKQEQSIPEGLKTPPSSQSQGGPFVTPQTGGVPFTNLLDTDTFPNTLLGSGFTTWLGLEGNYTINDVLTNIYNYITSSVNNPPIPVNDIQPFNEITNSNYTTNGVNPITELRRSKRISARDQRAFNLQMYVNSDDFKDSIVQDSRFGSLTIPEPTEAHPEPGSPVIVSQSTLPSTPRQPTSAAAVTPGEIPSTETLETLGIRVNDIRNNLGDFLRNTCNFILSTNITNNLNNEIRVVELATTLREQQERISYSGFNHYIINNAAPNSDNDFCPVTSVIDGMPQCNQYQGRLEYGNMDFTIRKNNNQNNYYRGWVNSTNWNSSISNNPFPQSIRYSYEIRSNTLHIPRENCVSFPLWLKGNSEQRGDANIHITLAKCLQTTLNYYANFIDIQSNQVTGQLIGNKIDTFSNLYTISTNNNTTLSFVNNSGIFYTSGEIQGNINGLGIILSKILLKGAGDLFQEINAICKWGGYERPGPMYAGQQQVVRYNNQGNAQRIFRTNDRISGARAYYMWYNLDNAYRNELFCGSRIELPSGNIEYNTEQCNSTPPRSKTHKRGRDNQTHTSPSKKQKSKGGTRKRRKIYRKKRTKKSKKPPRTRKRRLKKGTTRRKIK